MYNESLLMIKNKNVHSNNIIIIDRKIISMIWFYLKYFISLF